VCHAFRPQSAGELALWRSISSWCEELAAQERLEDEAEQLGVVRVGNGEGVQGAGCRGQVHSSRA
jgi:hypothetical protein